MKKKKSLIGWGEKMIIASFDWYFTGCKDERKLAFLDIYDKRQKGIFRKVRITIEEVKNEQRKRT